MIETSWAYSQFKNGLDTSSSSINLAGLLNKKTTSFNKLKLIENDFESIVIPAYPEIGEIKEKLCAFGAQYASLSGSGSTVFGIFNDEAFLEKAFSYFTPKYNTFISSPIWIVGYRLRIGASSNGRTPGFGPGGWGSSPYAPALKKIKNEK